MLYFIKWLERKDDGWIKASLEEAVTSTDKKPATYLNVSINKIDKKTGQVAFPQFDDLMPGQEIEGEIWQSPTNHNWYLFPPRAKKASGGAYNANKTASITKAMEKKEESIEKFQSHKEESIKLASAQRDAVIMVCAVMEAEKGRYSDTIPDKEKIRNLIIEWRNWFLNDTEFNNPPPF